MKPFDEKFADRVREVFDLYRESPDPMAWEAMKERLDQSRRQRVIALLPLFSRAAAILLFVGISAFLFTDIFIPGTDEQLAMEVPVPTPLYPAGSPESPLPALPDPVAPAHASRAVSAARPLIVDQAASTPAPEGFAHISPASPTEVRGMTLASGELAFNEPESARYDEEIRIVDAFVFEPSYQDYGTSRALRNERSGFSWGFTASSMMTFAEQQLASGMGFSGGLVTEWKAFPRMKISSGMMLAYQQFEVERMPLRMISNQEILAGLDYNDATAYGDHEYEFLAIDIPMNLQFNLGETRRSQLYVSAGVSSLLYLQQRVSGYSSAFITGQTYNPATGQYQPFSQYSEVYLDDNYNGLTRFDFARLLNFSFGYVIKGDSHSTVIEPFIKYPLGTISTRELKMGMGGVTLRYRFGSN
jgi:hypothetical protein